VTECVLWPPPPPTKVESRVFGSVLIELEKNFLGRRRVSVCVCVCVSPVWSAANISVGQKIATSVQGVSGGLRASRVAGREVPPPPSPPQVTTAAAAAMVMVTVMTMASEATAG
jgi:hypothetical protein